MDATILTPAIYSNFMLVDFLHIKNIRRFIIQFLPDVINNQTIASQKIIKE